MNNRLDEVDTSALKQLSSGATPVTAAAKTKNQSV
jgi:hypothetical protein